MPPDEIPAIARGGNVTGMNDIQAPEDRCPAALEDSGERPAAPGVFRLFGKELAGQISWLLPLAIWGFSRPLLILWKNKDNATKAKLRSICFWGMWMLPMLVYFSIAGFFHRYYLIMLAPSIAALCGIGLTVMWNEYTDRGSKAYLLPLSLVVTALVQLVFVHPVPGAQLLADTVDVRVR